MLGWKTKLGGGLAIVTGIGLIGGGLLGTEWGDTTNGLLVLSGGIVAIGWGHKLDKILSVFKK